jgi:hypothetical protein
MFSNYFRIVTLIILDCTQNTLHIIGWVTVFFGIYQVVPMVLIINYFKPKINEIEANFQSKRIPIILTFVIFITSLELKPKMIIY